MGYSTAANTLANLSFEGASGHADFAGWVDSARLLPVALAVLAWRMAAAAAPPIESAPPAKPARQTNAPAAEPANKPTPGELPLADFRPRSMLAVEEHLLKRARFAAVDVHVHPRIRLRQSSDLIDAYVKLMDAQHIAVSVSLDGGLGPRFLEHRDILWAKHRDRWVIFANVDWRGTGDERRPETWDCQRSDFGRRVARQLAEAKAAGASGLKVFKDLGLGYRNPDGSFIRVDDPRWDPIWEACGKLALPVLIHTADPKAFFLPIDASNERYEELSRHPEWSFAGPGFPSYDELIKQFLAIVGRHRQTTFIGAHVASNAEDLAAVGGWLDEHPNLYVDIAARIGELGRQPRTARRLFRKACRAHPVWHRWAAGARAAHLPLAAAGDGRRILSVCRKPLPAARLLADLRARAAGRRAQASLLRERLPTDPGRQGAS